MAAATAPEGVRTVAVVGTGVIGGGWAAYFLSRGYDVLAYDPGPGAAGRLRDLVDASWPALARLGLARGADRSRLRFTDSLAEALRDTQFVQESTPEDLAAKIRVLAEIDALTPSGVVVASSTSGFAMSDLATDCAHPGRFVVGHPFNPPYLIPLVEVCGGAGTDPETVAWAERFYDHIGKHALVLDRELPGFVGNRLQDALWREALHMVAEGEATVDQIDRSIAHGPGLRWAQMGPCLTFHLAGGPGGMAHMLDHFGPALLEPWTRLVAPPLTPALRDAMVAGCDAEAGGRSFEDLVAERDTFLVDVLLLRDRDASTRLGSGSGRGADPRQTPFPGLRTLVPASWVDYNGHMTDTAYAAAFARAGETFLEALGYGADYLLATGRTTYTVESTLRYRREVPNGSEVRVECLLTQADDKRLRVASILRGPDGTTAATAEYLYLHVDRTAGTVVPFGVEQQHLHADVLAAHGAPAGPGSLASTAGASR